MTTEQDEHVAPVEAWDAIAADYDRYVAPGEAGLAVETLRVAGLQPGERFLDVAAGPGGLSLPAARIGARVLPLTGRRR
jgi:2-polyprenyl-3-methyl-5-hydroxy-6-metoxy-1,4-benzoquinol methylase